MNNISIPAPCMPCTYFLFMRCVCQLMFSTNKCTMMMMMMMMMMIDDDDDDDMMMLTVQLVVEMF